MSIPLSVFTATGAGINAGRIVPQNFTPSDGEYVYCIGSDLSNVFDTVAIGEKAAISQDVDVTSLTLIHFAMAMRNTEAKRAATMRGLQTLYPIYLTTGDDLQLTIDALAPQTLTFQDTDNSLQEIVDRCNAQLVGATAVDDNAQLKIVSDTLGSASVVDITGGVARAPLGFSITSDTGEHVTYKFTATVGGTPTPAFQAAAGSRIDYARRTLNVSGMSGVKTVLFEVEAVAA